MYTSGMAMLDCSRCFSCWISLSRSRFRSSFDILQIYSLFELLLVLFGLQFSLPRRIFFSEFATFKHKRFVNRLAITPCEAVGYFLSSLPYHTSYLTIPRILRWTYNMAWFAVHRRSKDLSCYCNGSSQCMQACVWGIIKAARCTVRIFYHGTDRQRPMSKSISL